MEMRVLPPDSLIHPLVSIIDRLPLEKMFAQAQPLEVELGSGDGSFLVDWAKTHPEHSFLGVERFWGRISKTDRKSRRAGLANTRLVRIEASYLLEYLLPAQSTQAIHLYFPDPWPKRKHRRHRLVNERFPNLARQALQPGGVVYLRTDDADYFAQMLEVFAASRFFKPIETPAELALRLTDFERGFLARGVQTQRAAYARIE